MNSLTLEEMDRAISTLAELGKAYGII